MSGVLPRVPSDPKIPGPKDTGQGKSGGSSGSGTGMSGGGAATLAHVSDMDAYDMDLATPGVSNSVATPDEVSRILRTIMDMERGNKKVFVDTAAGSRLLMQNVIRVMADVGTSRFTRYDITFADPSFVLTGPAYMDDIAAAIKQICTLRQFAAYFAPMYWNWSISKGEPPANWSRKGGTEDTKFACFDFFFGVTHAASIGGRHKKLERWPTATELNAAQVNVRVGVVRAAQEAANLVSHYTEVTRGRIGGGPRLGLLPAPEPQE